MVFFDSYCHVLKFKDELVGCYIMMFAIFFKCVYFMIFLL